MREEGGGLMTRIYSIAIYNSDLVMKKYYASTHLFSSSERKSANLSNTARSFLWSNCNAQRKRCTIHEYSRTLVIRTQITRIPH